MTAAARPHIDGWSWPPALDPPATTIALPAGGAIVRVPDMRRSAPDALQAALREAARALASTPVRDRIAVLGSAAESLADSLDARATESVAANAELSPPMTQAVLAEMAGAWTRASLSRLVAEEFPDPRVLDGFAPGRRRRVRARGPALVLHVGSGSVPGVTVTSILRAMLLGSAVLAKPGAGDVALAVRFAEVLKAARPDVAAALAVQYWPGGHEEWDAWERAALAAADQVVVYGSDAVVESVRARTPARVRLVEHGHRVGAAVVDPANSPRSAVSAARAVALADQRGCVSAHLFFVLAAPAETARWCEALAAELGRLARTLPPGAPAAGLASAVHQLRGRLALKAAAGEPVRVWSSAGVEWTVALAGIDDFAPVGGRTAWVVPATGRDACLAGLASLRGVLQSVGLAGVSPEEDDFADALFALGATRIVPLERMPFPAADWLHDGRRPLRELAVWGEAAGRGDSVRHLERTGLAVARDAGSRK